MSNNYFKRFEGRAEKYFHYLTEELIYLFDKPKWTDHQKYLWPVVLAVLAGSDNKTKIDRAQELLNKGSYKNTRIEKEHNKSVDYNK